MEPCTEHKQTGGSLVSIGYARTHRNILGKRTALLMHRAVFWDKFGYLPEVVMHACDNPRCINPAHLRGGTQQDNVEDMLLKGRTLKAQPKQRKLSAEQVKYVRGSTLSNRILGTELGVGKGVIEKIRSGATYKDVV